MLFFDELTEPSDADEFHPTLEDFKSVELGEDSLFALFEETAHTILPPTPLQPFTHAATHSAA